MFRLPHKYPVLGIEISVTSVDEVCGVCRDWIASRRPSAPAVGLAVFLCNVHSIMTGVLHRRFGSTLNEADIAAPDGMPVAWALRSFGEPVADRVYGPDLMLALCAQAARESHRIYLYGGREELLPVLSGKLRERFPGLRIAGAYSPPFRPLTAAEDAACTSAIRAADPDIVFVGIGAPKQERWIAQHRSSVPCVWAGVGAAFDFHAGRVRQAPRAMQSAGLEWLFRLCMEPLRLWKRYLLLNPLFLVMWGMQKMGLLQYGGRRSETSGPAATGLRL